VRRGAKAGGVIHHEDKGKALTRAHQGVIGDVPCNKAKQNRPMRGVGLNYDIT
jgi:hypothetical protein